METAPRVAELKRVRAEGLAADVGAANPYRGQLANAAVWRSGYQRMLDAMIANSPARRRGGAEPLASALGERVIYTGPGVKPPGQRAHHDD